MATGPRPAVLWASLNWELGTRKTQRSALSYAFTYFLKSTFAMMPMAIMNIIVDDPP